MTPLLCALVLMLPVDRASVEAGKLASRMEARYRGAKTLQATFLERYAENGTVLRSEAGTAYFRRPGKMRWEYERPEKDLFLVDGKTAWFYVPSDHTVTRIPAKQSQDLRTPLALLAGEMKISRICARVEFAEGEKPSREGDAVLRCRVRGERKTAASADQPDSALGANGADSIFFEVARDSGELMRLIVRQAGGVEVEFRFENWRFDPPVPETMFRFELPAGVAIVNGELANGKPQGN
ncbi:MAG: outer rane lipoprotein carrier protein LolA [Candidatus Acidoferrum typicum]|nr:outer rane lipoprotein carrier protein LolA [Candidatus Acidoferrum typicum]